MNDHTGASEGVTARVDVTWDGAPLPAREQVEVRLAGLPSGELEIRVEAPFHDDPPPPGPPGRTPGLWEHEVVEVFLLAAGSRPPRYLEVELSPHGHHLALALRGRRRVVDDAVPISFAATVAGDRWQGQALVPAGALPPPPWRGNVYAIHGIGEGRRYLAWQPVAGPRPDFHRLDQFAPLPARLWQHAADGETGSPSRKEKR